MIVRLIRLAFLLSIALGYCQEASVLKTADTAQYYLNAIKEHYRKGEYKLHKAYSDSLFDYAQNRALVDMQIKALVNQGVNLNMHGDYQNAIETYRNALKLSKTIPKDVHTKVLVMVNLANTYSNIELYDESTSLMQEVLQMADLTQNPDVMRMAALSGLSKNYSVIGNEIESLNYAKQVRSIAKILGDRTAELTAINHISNSYYKLGDYAKAIAIAEEALAYKEMALPTKAKAWVLLSLGEAHVKLEHYLVAEPYLKDALQIAQHHKLLDAEVLCYEKLIQVYKAKDDKQALIDAEQSYANAKINILSNQKESASNVLKAKIVTKEQEQKAYEQSISELTLKNKLIIVAGCIVIVFLIVFLYRYKTSKPLFNKGDKQEAVSTLNVPLTTERYKNSTLSETDRKIYKQQLEQLMAQDKPYLKDTFNQTELAGLLKISTHHLSEVLHYEFKQNFYALINQYRVNYSKNLLLDAKHKNTKMLAIAYESGFKSKTTFYRAFKNLVGKTPLEYKTQNKS